MIFGAVYMLRMYKNVMQGETNTLTAAFTDIAGSEKLVLGIICLLIIVIGIYPQPILHISDAAVKHLVQNVSYKFYQAKP
jgi:NADH-quinone oxidoreductase subunit M